MNMKKERVIENLRQALHILLKEDPFVFHNTKFKGSN